MKEAGKNLGEMIREFVGNIPQMLTGIDFGGIFGGLVSAGSTAWDTIKDIGAGALAGAVTIGTLLWNGFSAAGSLAWSAISAVGSAVWSGLSAAGALMWAGIKKVAEFAWNGIKKVGEIAWSAISAAGSFFIKYVINPIKTAIKWVVDKVKWIVDKISGIGNFFGGIGNAIGGAFGGVKSFLGLAGGGAVAPNRPAPYILGDNKREYEIVSPVSLMEKAVMSAIAKSGGTGGGSAGPIELVVNLDSRAIARTIYDPLKNEGTRRGTHL